MVSNVTIDRLCAHLTNYRGCFSLDQIFGIKREVYKAPSSFVINTFESKCEWGALVIGYVMGRPYRNI